MQILSNLPEFPLSLQCIVKDLLIATCVDLYPDWVCSSKPDVEASNILEWEAADVSFPSWSSGYLNEKIEPN